MELRVNANGKRSLRAQHSGNIGGATGARAWKDECIIKGEDMKKIGRGRLGSLVKTLREWKVIEKS